MKTARARIFLGGPIQYALRSTGFDPSVRGLLSSLAQSIESSGFELLSAHRVERFGEADGVFLPGEVTLRDFRWACACDAYVCVLPRGEDGKPYRSDGTCIELGWVSALRKQIIIILDPELGHTHLVKGLYEIADVMYLPVRDVASQPGLIVNVLQAALGRSFRFRKQRLGPEEEPNQPWPQSLPASARLLA